MTNNTELKQRIDQQIQSFAQRPLRQTALSLFSALGYTSDRTVETRSVQDFREQFDPENLLSNPAAQVEQWHNVEFLFQLTDEELSSNAALFKDDSVRTSLLQSYVFIAIELREGDYARGKLANIARQINRIFPMPVMVLFKVGGLLSFAVINRRQNKRDENKDVLGKVTLIQNIAIGKPHPGHLDILATFSLTELSKDKRSIQNFDQLHAAWEDVFNVELLNKRFYRELANWYFWALPQVDFPADIEKDDEKRRATGLIRLLTRLIFCWFLKEKSLVPEKLFVESDLKNILKDLSPDASTYNEAILQNLFFATLNQRMGKDAQGQPFRVFAKDEGFQKNRVTYGVDTLFRYEEHFQDPDNALDHFADVPFLNGGLFECLDRIETGTGKKLYLDGFSRNVKKRPTIPNRLFFGSEREQDLSGAYGDTKRKKEKVRGLLRILHAYKFTIVENTPVDQEIALDPELLGKVFENLLASYNEETKTTARKQTGSFYTPRPIVDYMVDESLKAHLTGALAKTGMSEKDAQAGLDILFTYTERAHPFSEQEVVTLLDAIHTCKILDPACGSGAFPMGMLHKLVYIIHKLDPDNARWKQLQVDAAAKIPDLSAREAAIAAIERDFADNENDYGRKLYLIENCLYGVDIQPIAIQISKLRFFISLVCDQRTNRNKRDNHGIRPLPNLETKFVAANTLIGLPTMDQLALLPGRVYQIEAEIEALYHSHFAIQRREQKLALQKKIKGLRVELGKLLAESLGSSKKTQHIADWDPFDPQATSDFFDQHWMFGRALADGFTIVIGNPPYVQVKKGLFPKEQFRWSEGKDVGKQNLYKVFLEAAHNLAKSDGICCLIVQSSLMADLSSARTREMLLTQTKIGQILEFPKIAPTKAGQVFESVLQGTCICLFQNTASPDNDFVISCNNDVTTISSLAFETVRQSEITRFRSGIFEFPLFKPGEFDIYRRLFTNSIKFKALMVSIEKGDLNLGTNANSFSQKVSPVKLYRGRNIHRFSLDEDVSDWVKTGFFPDKVKRNGENMLLVCQEITGTVDPRRLIFTLIDKPGEKFLFGDTVQKIILRHQAQSKAVLAILNSRLMDWCFRKTSTNNHVGGYELEALPFPAKIPAEAEIVLTTLIDCLLAANRLGEAVPSAFFEALIDACVFELYFREHMAERDILFFDELAPCLTDYRPDAPESQQREFIVQLHDKLNAPSSTIRNRLLRISADSPDLLAVIKEGGKA
jgi:type I restriction-modification system DNA methylase subunit